MAVLDPVKLIVTNYAEGAVEELPIENNPEDESAGERVMPFSRELWIEREDFMEAPPKKFFRLGPGLMARLKGAYIVKCEDFKKDADGKVTEIHCTYIPESKSGHDTSGINVKGTIHWVSALHAATAEVRMYDRLFKVENPAVEEGDFKDYINPDSLHTITAFVEPSMKDVEPGYQFQAMRKGYFCVDRDSAAGALVFNRTTGLKDAWAKEVKKG
jgi:glutaminyl-tRNA synthetase